MGKVKKRIIKKDGQEFIEEIHKIIVHTIRMGDVEDPDLFVAEPIWNWQQTDAGKFVMEHAIEKPIWHRQLDAYNYGWEYAIVAEFKRNTLVEYYLKFGNENGITRSR